MGTAAQCWTTESEVLGHVNNSCNNFILCVNTSAEENRQDHSISLNWGLISQLRQIFTNLQHLFCFLLKNWFPPSSRSIPFSLHEAVLRSSCRLPRKNCSFVRIHVMAFGFRRRTRSRVVGARSRVGSSQCSYYKQHINQRQDRTCDSHDEFFCHQSNGSPTTEWWKMNQLMHFYLSRVHVVILTLSF